MSLCICSPSTTLSLILLCSLLLMSMCPPSNGRAVHYNGSSLLQWRSVRLDVTLTTGDLAGIGWERQGEASSSSLPNHPGKGLVYFTYNGRRLQPTIDEVSGAMWPVVHIQKKVRVLSCLALEEP